MKTIFFVMMLITTVTSCNLTMPESTKKILNNQDILNLVEKNDIQGVSKALQNGADVNTRDKSKRSLLLIATINHQTELAKLLVTQGADVNLQADNQDSPFLYAGASGQTELVQLFLNHGARFDIFNRYQGTALIPACERGHIETVQLLANTKGFPIDHVNRLGWTALMEAVLLGDGSEKYQRIVQILKDAGAKLDIPDHQGVTPLQHAQTKGFREIVKILQP
ncbi:MULTISPECIES: ankyrin repeat domain-containing protein [Olivibacter]|uniref:Ankyrin repeat domain-containing protein n=1 Tax=Olivibacter jilunii TaxID=985016 RepID=A0ABW6BAY3_9SPHI|nr:ankyrin repeat domain-containing protein [Olivibacter sp. UJ_SKK_5.1]MDX3912790.1 ankyrin repeat domain-containing protein [Pseudosphingobacterium sp.]